MRRIILAFTAIPILALLVLLVPAPVVQAQNPLAKINHVIILYLENHTVDNLYSGLPGVNGINSPGGIIPQVDLNDKPYSTLPPVLVSFRYDGFGKPIDTLQGLPDPRFPDNVPNKPFLIDPYVPNNQLVGTPLHRFYHYQLQINGGAMNKFVAWSDVGAQVMGYYDTTKLPLYAYAKNYTFADNFFTAAFGGSWLNHMWLVCACTPIWKNAPPEYIAKPVFDAQGKLVNVDTGEDGVVSPDGYGINTGIDSFYPPHGNEDDAHRMPPQDFLTIGDRLTAAGVSWTEYNGGWDDVLDNRAEEPIPFLAMPPLSSHGYFKPYGPGMPGRDHLKDAQDFVPDMINGNLSAVTILKPEPAFDEHPGYSIVEEAEKHGLLLIQAIQLSKYWDDTALFITYDDYGGQYDHVPPPVIDRWGPGSRVPLIVISPYAKKQFVDHTQYDTTSMLKFIETRWNLQPLGTRDAATNDLSNAFDFSQVPTTPVAPQPVTGQDKPAEVLPSQNPYENILIGRNAVIGGCLLVLVILALGVFVLRRRTRRA